MLTIIFFLNIYIFKLKQSHSNIFKNGNNLRYRHITAVQLVFNTFSSFVPQLELYSHLPPSVWGDPVTLSVPKST